MRKSSIYSKNRIFKLIKLSDLFDILKYLVVVLFLIWLMARGTERLGYNWQWYRIPKYLFLFDERGFHFGPLLSGLMVTFRITALGLVLSMLIGMITALLRLSESFLARLVARVYLELIRNTPLLVQIFFLYFVLAPLLDLSRFFAGVIALSLFEGAYVSEIFRSGIVSIQRGQWEACYSLGLSNFDTYRMVILPQAVRRILPPLTGQAISLIKDSALVSTIAIYDLTMEGRAIIAETFLTFEIWFTIALMYLVITTALSIVANQLEARFHVYS